MNKSALPDVQDHVDDDADLGDRGDAVNTEVVDEPKDEPKAKPKAEPKAEEPEAEPEGEAEDDEPEDDEAEDDEPKGKKDQRVPFKRFQQVVQQRRELEQRLAEAEAKINERKDTEVNKAKEIQEKLDTLYEEVEEARARGNTKEAARIQREIDSTRAQITRAESALLARMEAAKAQEISLYNVYADQLATLDTRFDPNSDEYDHELVQEVKELTEAYEARGYKAHEALRKAARKELGKDLLDPKIARGLKKEEPEPKAKKTNVSKNADAARRQPPTTPTQTEEKPGKIDVASLSEEEFNALPEATKKRLRGD